MSTSEVTRLQIYNEACRHLGERPLTSTDENRAVKHLLDDCWDFGKGFVNQVLEKGLWNFAIATVKYTTTSTLHSTGTLRWDHVYAQSTDYVRLAQISADESFGDTIHNYEEEAGSFYTDDAPIYVRYVSDSTSFGGNYANWPNSFSQYVGAELALRVAPHHTNSAKSSDIKASRDELYNEARKLDALDEPIRFQRLQNWTRARFGRTYGRRDRGSRSSLTS